MKKIILGLCIFLLISCDNNSGPFTIQSKNDQYILYSGNKPAKGWVTNSYSIGNKKVVISEIEYDNGLPTGKMTLYDIEGKFYLKTEFDGKMKDFIINGKISKEINKFQLGLHFTDIVTGEIQLNPNRIIEYDPTGIFTSTISYEILNGKSSKYKDNILVVEEIYENGKLLKTCFYGKNGKKEREYIPQGQAPENMDNSFGYLLTYDEFENVQYTNLIYRNKFIKNQKLMNRYNSIFDYLDEMYRVYEVSRLF